MRTVVAALVLAWFSGCSFQSSPLSLKKAAVTHAKSRTGKGGSVSPAPSLDAGEQAQAANGPTQDEPMDAAGAPASPMQDASMSAAPPPTRDDAGLGDSGAFGMNPIPTGPSTMPQNGGLQCGVVFCPYATDPVKPCCTTKSDVEHGAARAAGLCGLDLSGTSSQFYSDLCWQRDEPGVIDSSCPGVNVGGSSDEPGCCSDEGRCGGVNTDQALGCHYDPSAPTKECGGATVAPDAGTSTHCDLLGVYGIRYVVDLTWGGRSGGLVGLTDDGRGKQVIHMLASIDSIDPQTLALTGTARVCGASLPTFYSTTLCEAYEPVFPTAMWDSDKMPRLPISGKLQCLDPGCILSIDAQTVLAGISLKNPEAPWPTSDQTPQISCAAGTGVKCFPDHDGDGQPGLTVHVATQGVVTGTATTCSGMYTKRAAPLNSSITAIFGGVHRTDRVMLGVRMKVGGSATLGNACASASGSGIAEYVNSRAWSCMVQQGTYNFPNFTPAGPNDVCSSAEASFMDANLPIYDILAVGKKPDSKLTLLDTSASQGPLVSIVRLGDAGASLGCADARDAKYP